MFTRNPRFFTLVIVSLAFALSLVGCSAEGGRAALDLLPLQRALVAEYEGARVQVHLQDGHRLGITLSAAASKDLAYETGPDGAQGIAEFVCRNYASMGQIDRLRVAFGVRGDGLLARPRTTVAYAWDRDELPCQRPG